MAKNPFSDPNYGADLTPEATQPTNPFADPEYGKEPSLTARVKQGASRAVDSARTALTDDPNKIAQIAAEQSRNALPQSATQRQMAEEFAPYVDAANKAEGVVDNVKAWGAAGFKRAGQLLSNPGEAAKMVAEQLPNSIPALAAGFAGAKAGAALGTAVAPGVGTAVGGVLGGIAGGFAGSYGLEKGAAMQEQVQKEAQARNLDLQNETEVAKMVAERLPEFDSAAQRKGIGTAGTDAVLNVATMGLAGMGGRTLAKEARTLAESVKAGTISAADAATDLARLETANAARNTIKARALRGTGVVGAEMAGEGASEAVGQKFAYGKVDAGEVIDESLMGLGTGGAMALGSKAFNKAAGIVDQDATTKNLAAARDGLAALGPSFTTSPGAADPNAPSGPQATPPEAPDLTTSQGAGVARDGIDFTRDVDTSGLSLQDAAELARQRAATVDYQPGDTTPQWDTQPGAAAPRTGLDMPAPDFDTGALGFDPRPLSERMGLDPARGSLTSAAALAVDTGASPVQFLGATGRDMQLRQSGPGVANESNVIDVQGRVVEDRAIGTPRRLTNPQDGMAARALGGDIAAQPPANRGSVPALPAPTNLRDAIARIRAQKQEAANAQTSAPQAASTAQSVPAAGTGAVEAAGIEEAIRTAPTIVEVQDNYGRTHRVRQSDLYSNADRIPTVRKNGEVVAGEEIPRSIVKDAPSVAPNSGVESPNSGVQRRAAQTTQGNTNATQTAQAQQASPQPAQAGATPATSAAPGQASPAAPAGASTVRALTDGAPTANPGAQAAPAAGAQTQAPQGPVARSDGWRKTMLRAAPIARSMGIDPTGKRLAQVVAEIDAADAQSGGAVNTMRGLAQQFRDRHAITKQDADRTFAAVLDRFAGEVEQGKRTPQSVQQAIARYKELAAQPVPATHADPGEKAEAATPAVVTDSIKKAARNEDAKPSDMRKWLVGKIDEAIAVAPESAVDFLSFDVPGDGTFKVQNSQARLQEFRKKVMASPGFKDGGQRQNTQPPEQTDSARNGSGSTVEAIRNFLADGDVQSAVEFAKLKGVEFTPVEPRASMTANGKFKRVPASVTSKPPSVAEGLTQVEAEQLNQYLTAERARAETAAAQDAVQQSPQDFIPAPDGGLDYGEITPEMGKAMRRQAGKIRLRRGDETQGLVHIAERHLDQFKKRGFESVSDFVASVAKSFTAIYKRDGAALDVVLEDGSRGRLVVQLEMAADGDFYDVKTASPIREDQFKNREPLWERAGTSTPTAGESSPPSPWGQNGADSVPPNATAAQPITRADVTAAQQQAATLIAERIDAMTAGEVNTIARRFLPTMGVKPTVSKERNKAAVTDFTKVNPIAAADEFGVTLPADVRRALEAEMQGKVADGFVEATAAKLAAAKPAAAPQPEAPAAPITDFGEKIGGARKDVWSGFKDDLNKVLDDDIAGQPLTKVWPAPDYQKLIDAGMNTKTVAAVRALRDEVPAKPRAAWKVKRWAEQVKTLRSLANDVMDGKITVADMERMGANKGTSLRGMMGRIELYELVGHEKSLEGVRFAHHHYTLYKGRENVSLWVVEKDAGATAFSNWPREIATGDTKEQALAAFKEKYAGLDLEKAVRKASFDIFSERGSNAFYVGKKIGRNYAKLEGPFKTVKEAREYREKNLQALEAKLEKYKEIPRERADVNQPRVGVDMRNGQDVTPQMFGEVFGFRGVEFGNWVEQKRRQKDLNDAFDAFMDMAAVLDIPPKAISLNGKLGLAFGARGSGGVHPAAAHYEPDNVVINLTKKEGAGSLGHEWWHALDNYFAKQRATNRGSFMTTGTDVGLAARGKDYYYEGGIRQEMIDAFGAVVKAINQTAMKARASTLDGKRTKDYWTTGEEMSARAFESYLISKLQDQNASNDYLANVVSEETWYAMAVLGMENENSYPYPTAAEIPAIRAGFDHFFQTVETRETEGGNVVMFSRTPATQAAIGTPAATIRAAVTKAYGKLLGQLESKGLVTLTQTEDEAIEAAAQARADKTGQPLAEVRASLMGSVSNSVATDTPAFKRWFGDSKVVDAEGKPLVVYHGTTADFSIFDAAKIKRKAAGAGFYFTTDPGQRGYAEGDGANVMPVYLSIKNPTANPLLFRTDESYDGLIFPLTSTPGVTHIAVRRSEQVKSATGNNGNFDPNDLDIRRSANGAIQGFFDPQTGQSFLIADNLTAEAAPGVLMHEVGIHMAADGSMKALFNRAAMMLKMQRGNPFMKAVQARMDAAGETSGEEAAAYIAEAYENDRANAPASVQRWLADLLAAVKAWMFKKGIMGADRLTVADIAAVARANARSMARDGGATGGQGFGPAFSRAPAGDQTQTEAFKRWFKGSKAVDASGKPLVVYHGTGADFSVFTRDRAGATSGAANAGMGFFFTDQPDVAGRYAQISGGAQSVMPVYLSLQNPIRLTAKNMMEADRLLQSQMKPEHDGAIIEVAMRDGGVQSVFMTKEASQVKSAIGNRGTFDPTNPDIRFSRAGVNTGGQAATGWDAPVQTGFDDVIYKLQDKNIDLKRVVEAISKATGKVADSINAYLKEELFHKRAAKRVADFGDRELKPLMNQMRLAGLSMEDVEEYLHARHAKEANAVIAQRNPGNAGLQDGGSGMTNAAADNYFAKLDPAQRRKLESVAAKVDAIIADTRKLYVDYGLEDQAVVDGWANMYQHYIPLMREDKDGGMGTGQGFSVKGKETKGRTGSTRKVVDILANVASQRERLIVRGEKNRVTQALVGLAQANPNPEFWEVRSQAPTERMFDPKSGVVVDRPDPLFKSRDNVVVAKVKDANGNVTEQMVVFNEDNPRAVRMAAAMKNLDAGNLEGLLGVSAKITRYFAAINTQYNPVFGVVNLVRDVQGAMVNLAATPLAGQQGKIAKDTVSALRGIYGDIRKTRKGGQATSQWSQLWEQMQDDGGTTGYRELFTTSADRANNLKSILNPESWMENKWGKFFTANGTLRVPMSMAQKGATEIFGWLSDYNEAMENGVRLAAYKAALDKGMSREQAASIAKNLTVNFNRKGQVGQQAGAVYAFFNAAMQGTARIGQTLFDMDGGDISTLRLSKTGKAVVYGGITLGAIQALALAAAGFDAEDPPEFVRERSLVIPTGGKTYVTIPMPLGLHVIPGIGRHALEFALSGFDKPAQRAVSVVGMFADAFNPIGNAGLSMQTIAPTALDPLVALTENKDWTGKPIARVSSNKALPGHTQWKDTATGFSKVVAEAINWVSGGNEYVAGAFSPTPDQIDYLIAQLGGGVAREAAKVQQTVSSTLSGEELPTYKVPLVGRFVGNAASQASQGSAFYANLNKLNELETEIKGLRKDGKFEEASQLIRQNPQAIMIPMANRAERDVQKLRREKRELIAKDASREEVRAKEDQITAVMTRLNEAAERRKALATQ